MAQRITRDQLGQLEDVSIFSREELHEQLEAMTGITARPYTAYSYYDAAGNYIGDSSDKTLYDLLEAAYIEVIDDE